MKPQRLTPMKVALQLCSTTPPYPHLQPGSYAMLCYKSQYARQVIKEEFNFALFVKDLAFLSVLCSIKIQCVKIAIKYGIDQNEVDPVYRRNALHHVFRSHCASKFRDYCVWKLNIDPNALDINKLPPCAYGNSYHYPSLTMDSVLRFVTKRESEKLFQFLFSNVIPEKWSNLSVVNHSLLRAMPEDKRVYLLQNARDEKGNSILHLAAKRSDCVLISYILETYPTLQQLVNQKGTTL